MTVHRVLVADPGEYELTGNPATFRIGRVLTATAGSYTFTGLSAVLTYANPGAEPEAFIVADSRFIYTLSSGSRLTSTVAGSSRFYYQIHKNSTIS